MQLTIDEQWETPWKEYKNSRLFFNEKGECRSAKTTKLRIIGCLNKDGYLTVKPFKNKHHKPIHQIVMELFGTPKPNDPTITIDHIDGIKTNNHIKNLQWLPNAKNAAQAGKHSRKLTFDQAQQIRKIHNEQQRSLRQTANTFNVDRKSIRTIIQNKTYLKP